MTATVAGYRVVETLASSESRTLLRAVDADGTSVVLKVLAAQRATPAEVARLRHELAVAADLPDSFSARIGTCGTSRISTSPWRGSCPPR